MTTAIYVRVSTTKQDFAAQEPELKRWSKAVEGDVEWFRDKASGRTMDRPGFEAMMDAVRTGRINRVVVWRLDRLGRTASGLVSLFEELGRHGATLVSLKDGIDLATASGRLMANVLASIAAFETELRGERVKAGIEAARAAGKHLGRPKGTGKALKVNGPQTKAVIELKAAGTSIVDIARITGLSRPTLYKILKDHACEALTSLGPQ